MSTLLSAAGSSEPLGPLVDHHEHLRDPVYKNPGDHGSVGASSLIQMLEASGTMFAVVLATAYGPPPCPAVQLNTPLFGVIVFPWSTWKPLKINRVGISAPQGLAGLPAHHMKTLNLRFAFRYGRGDELPPRQIRRREFVGAWITVQRFYIQKEGGTDGQHRKRETSVFPSRTLSVDLHSLCSHRAKLYSNPSHSSCISLRIQVFDLLMDSLRFVWEGSLPSAEGSNECSLGPPF